VHMCLYVIFLYVNIICWSTCYVLKVIYTWPLMPHKIVKKAWDNNVISLSDLKIERIWCLLCAFFRRHIFEHLARHQISFINIIHPGNRTDCWTLVMKSFFLKQWALFEITLPWNSCSLCVALINSYCHT